jgi:hypothetical protein
MLLSLLWGWVNAIFGIKRGVISFAAGKGGKLWT